MVYLKAEGSDHSLDIIMIYSALGPWPTLQNFTTTFIQSRIYLTLRARPTLSAFTVRSCD